MLHSISFFLSWTTTQTNLAPQEARPWIFSPYEVQKRRLNTLARNKTPNRCFLRKQKGTKEPQDGCWKKGMFHFGICSIRQIILVPYTVFHWQQEGQFAGVQYTVLVTSDVWIKSSWALIPHASVHSHRKRDSETQPCWLPSGVRRKIETLFSPFQTNVRCQKVRLGTIVSSDHDTSF